MKLQSKDFKQLATELRQKKHNRKLTPVDDAAFQKVMEQLSKGELKLPDDTFQSLIRSTVERDFLNSSVLGAHFAPKEDNREEGWIRITRLPISPLNDKNYALFPRWQNTIATLHTLHHRLCYVLLRINGETQIYLGALSEEPGVRGSELQDQLMQAVAAQMPGIGIEEARPGRMTTLRCCGAVTGIPSIRKITEYGEYQTMDQIAMGLRDAKGQEQDFAVIVVADPIADSKIVEILRSMEELGSEVHALTQHTRTQGLNGGESVNINNTDGTSFGVHGGGNIQIGVGDKLAKLIKSDLGINLGGSWSSFSSTTTGRSANAGWSDSVSQQYINKSAMYCEELFDKHIARMKAGRNLGFWKTGVYVMAQTRTNVQTIMGMLRAVYSGDDTYIEPIRTTTMPSNSGAENVVRQFQHLPFAYPPVEEALGSLYEDYATPMTTEELSIATSLPRRDVPGLRLIRNASRFANNPPVVKTIAQGGKPVRLGDVLDTGAPTHQTYRLDLNQLVRHALVVGTNGSGKTNTCKHLLGKAAEAGVPFLVIEPAKDEYMDWAFQWNKNPKNKKKIIVFAPGYFGKESVDQLKLNPFQPAVPEGEWVNMLAHLDRFKSALLSSMPMADVLPLVIEETLYKHTEDSMWVKDISMNQDGSPLAGPYIENGKLRYPMIEGMDKLARSIIEGRQYAKDVENNISAAVKTRISSLLLGWKKSLFNVPRSTDFAALFEKNSVVINLSYLTDDRDKALVMSILLIALWEYREAKFNSDPSYKKRAKNNELMHLTLIEEAHRLMPNVQADPISGLNSQAYTANMFSQMLSEIRAYGEGCIVVDQVPTRLIPDAVKNTNLKVVHRLTAEDDIRAVSTSMRLRPDQEGVIGALQPGEAIVCSDFDDAAAWVLVDNIQNIRR